MSAPEGKNNQLETKRRVVGDGTPGPGRPKGVPNKNTRLVKEAIAEAFDKLGGADRLLAWAKEDPDNERVFYTALLPKLIPVQTELSGRDGGPLQVAEIKRIIVDPRT